MDGNRDAIANEQVRCLPANISSIDQFVASADVQALLPEKPQLCEKLKALFT
jgi:hypothetical protein